MKKEATGFRLIFGYLGMFMIFIGFLTALPLLLLIFYPEEQACLIDFLAPLMIFIVVGAVLYFTLIFKRKRMPFVRCEDRHLIFLIWIAAILAGALPFVHANMAHGMRMNFSEAIFESTSAYSTTGLSVFKDYINVEGSFAPHVFCFHRALMQFVGGAGLVLVLASVLSSSGNMSLFSSEGHNDRLMPNFRHTAKLIFGIMSGYTAIGTLALWLAGMPIFDAVVISMCSISGGGMSPTTDSIGYYRTITSNGVLPTNSLAIEIIVMILSLMSVISFVLHYMFIRGKFGKFFKDAEIKFGILLIFLGTLVASVGALYDYSIMHHVSYGTNAGEILRDTVFFIVSGVATTGFSTLPISEMLLLGKSLVFVLIIIMTIGGGLGSCGGGIKQYRVILCLKDLFANIRYRFSPNRALNPTTIYRYGERKQIEESKIKEAHNYAVLYLFVFLGSSALLCFLPDINPEDALFSVASGMSNTGLSTIDFIAYGEPHPNAYLVMLWVLSVGMLLGRLEIMPLFDTIRNYVLEFKAISSEKRRKKEGFGKID